MHRSLSLSLSNLLISLCLTVVQLPWMRRKQARPKAPSMISSVTIVAYGKEDLASKAAPLILAFGLVWICLLAECTSLLPVAKLVIT
jgi:hypothetical protein